MLGFCSQLHNFGLLSLYHLLMMALDRIDGVLPLLKLAHEFLNLQILLTIRQFVAHILHAFKVLIDLQTLLEHVFLDN